jgi:hypothetical protein
MIRMMSRAIIMLAASCAIAGPGRAAFEKGGLLDAGPRSAALGGTGVVLGGDAISARANAAGLVLMGGPQVIGGVGMASAADEVTMVAGAGAMWEGLGLSVLAGQVSSGSAHDRTLQVGLGLPVEELPWLSIGASLKYLASDLVIARATGFGFDASVLTHFGLPWQSVEVTAAAGIEDALAGITWDDGLEEEPARQVRLGAGIQAGRGISVLSEVRMIRGAAARELILGFGLEESFAVLGIPAALRAGYRDGDQREASFTGGFGVRYGPVALDYAIAGMRSSLGWLHTASLTYEFGARAVPRTAGALSAYPVPLGNVVPEQGDFVLTSLYQTMGFRVRAPRIGTVASWAVLISDAGGSVVWTIEGEGEVPGAVEWAGGVMDGGQAPDGVYACQLVIKGPGTYQYLSPGTTFRLSRPGNNKRKDEEDAGGPGGF